MEKPNLSGYTIEELDALIDYIAEERYSLFNAQAQINTIELKTRYEGQWLISEDNPRKLVYVKEVLGSRSAIVLYFKRSEADYEVTTEGWDPEAFERWQIVDADEAGDWIADFMTKMGKFIEETICQNSTSL